MKKRNGRGQFSRRKHYKLPEKKIKPVLMWYYAILGVLVSCYLISGAFYECFQIVKTKFYETKKIIIIPEVGAGTSDGDSDVNRLSGEVSQPISDNTEEGVEDTIRRVAEEVGFEETENLIGIANCESSLNPMAINVNSDGSLDLGLFQINEKWHGSDRECYFDLECATRKAIEIQRKSGWNAWVCFRKYGF